MEKIKVAHILHTYLPVTENWIYNQLRFNLDCDPMVISQFRKNESHFPIESIYSACSNGSLQTICSFLSRLKLWPHQSFYNSKISKEKPDVIHGHFSTESCKVLNIARRNKIPLVTTFYGLDVNKLPRRKYWKKKYAGLFKYGDIFMVEGHHMADKLVEIGCNPEKIRVVHIGIDIDRIRKKLPLFPTDDLTFKILFVGLEREKKGSLDAAEAFCRLVKKCQNAQLHLVGDGKYREKTQKIFNDNGCMSKVVFHGMINVDKYHELLAACHTVLTPSITAADGDTEGGAPVVCIEAQAAGKVVVGTNHCDIPDIVLHKKTGLLCDEHDVDNLTANLLEIATNPVLRLKLGENGYKHVRENHSIEKQVAKIALIYRSALDRRY